MLPTQIGVAIIIDNHDVSMLLQLLKNHQKHKPYKDKSLITIQEDMNAQNLYTPRQLCEILKVSRETLRLWSEDGKLKTNRFAKTSLFR
jgi:hypothetical protein